MTGMSARKTIDILLVEDDQAHAELIRRGLMAGELSCQVRIAHDLAAARQAIAEKRPCIALVDMLLPDGQGPSLLLQKDDFPIVIMTSYGNEEAAVSAMKSGASDYVVKTKNSLLNMAHVVERTLREWHHITRRRKAEAELRHREAEYRQLSEQFQTLLEGIPDVLALIDRDMRLVWANTAARNAVLPGVTYATGHFCYQLWHDHDEVCAQCPALRAFESGATEEQIVERKQDNTLWGVKAFPLKNSADEVINVIILATDISEKVQLRAEVVRSGQLASVGELAAGVAHEINNPINGIINFGQLLADRYAEGEGRQYAEKIIEEGQRIAMIVRNLLSFACEPRSQQMVAVALPQVLDATLFLTDSQLQRDHIKVDLEIEPDLPEIAGQRQKLQQVILNLISNARYALNQKYVSAHTDKRIVINLQKVCIGDETRVRMMVTDYGTGIPTHLLPRVCDPFFTTKPHDKGTGLGMSISHGIIKDLGGRLLISSVEQRHTIISIDLPIFKEQRDSDAE